MSETTDSTVSRPDGHPHSNESRRELGVSMIGTAFMGAAHSVAWRTVGHAFELPMTARMRVVCGRDEAKTAEAAQRLGWEESATDWRQVIARDDIDIVDICTPGDSHAEIAIAALAAGKHVICEKPLANTVAEAEQMAEAAKQAAARGVRSMVAFNYRRMPAPTYARELIASGRLGTIRHVRARYLQDWIMDPDFPLVWRLQKDKAGSGALGDIGAHIIDLAEYVTDQRISGVSGLTETFIKQRPLSSGATGGLTAGTQADESGQVPMGEVTVDDAALFLARFSGGAIGTFEATRFAAGHKNGLFLEIEGSQGSLAWGVERLNELQFYDATQPAAEAGFRTILVTEADHPYMAAWWPAGHIIGWEHSFTHEVRDFLECIGNGTDPAPSFADGLHNQRTLAAVEESAADRSTWREVPTE